MSEREQYPLFLIGRRLRSHLKNSCLVVHRVSKYSKTIEKPSAAFISFLVFGNRGGRSVEILLDP